MSVSNIARAVAAGLKAFFGAGASTLLAAIQFLPPGGGAATTVPGPRSFVQCVPTTVDRFTVAQTGAAGNVAGQTIAYVLTLNGVQIGPTLTFAANSPANTQQSAVFTPVPLVVGDILRAQLTPSAALTTALTDLMFSVA